MQFSIFFPNGATCCLSKNSPYNCVWKHMFRNGLSSSWHPGGVTTELCLHPEARQTSIPKHVLPVDDFVLLFSNTDRFKIWNISDSCPFCRDSRYVKLYLDVKRLILVHFVKLSAEEMANLPRITKLRVRLSNKGES